ncbi:MAG TPA: PIN domain-containing protein, partial [Bryobacteraceae bacterium]|nr:PIN domain-containing protein [Bryobacteraceae bacterium]
GHRRTPRPNRTAGMGLVLDSSVLIAAEREQRSVSNLLASLQTDHAETLFMELEHGWHRANTPDTATKRRAYLDEVFAVIPVEPFTREMAVLAARIDAEARQLGIAIAVSDLLIAVTALHYGYAVGTRNVRHFRIIPGLTVPSL